jgi:hypothetical protein
VAQHTQRKLTTPDSPKKNFKDNTHTHQRHATPAPTPTTPAHSGLLRTACAPTTHFYLQQWLLCHISHMDLYEFEFESEFGLGLYKSLPGIPRCFSTQFFISRKSTKQKKKQHHEPFFLALPISKKNQQRPFTPCPEAAKCSESFGSHCRVIAEGKGAK